MTTVVIAGVRPWAGERADVRTDDGVITAVTAPGAPRPEGAAVIDGADRVALPSFTDAHAHLDSTRLGLPFRPHSAGPGLTGLIENDLANWRSAEKSVTDRATYTLGATIASGVTTVRSHAQVDTRSGLDRLDGVLAARAAHAGRASVQVVAFPQAGVVRDPGTAALLGDALAAGADLIGGLDPCAIDRDPAGQLDTVFGLAERHGTGLDIHLHEPGELGLFTLGLIAERARALDMRGTVTVSHVFALAAPVTPAVEDALAEIAELDIALTTIAPSGPRVLPTDALARHGIRTGLGQDGTRDYWSPYGDGDMLGRTWQLAFVNQFRRDDAIERCAAIATIGGRAVIDPAATIAHWSAPGTRGIAAGDPADLVLIPGETVTSAIMDRPGGRTVVHRGRVVADDGALV